MSDAPNEQPRPFIHPFERAFKQAVERANDSNLRRARLVTMCPNDQPEFGIIVTDMPAVGATVHLYPDEHSNTPVRYTVTKIDGERIVVARKEADRE